MAAEPERPGRRDVPIVIAPARYVLLPLAEAITGYTVEGHGAKDGARRLARGQGLAAGAGWSRHD